MMSLGTLLVKHGWITKQQLGLAISRQREVGGRLGTCLLEMEAVSEELLNRSLAEQQGVPTAGVAELAQIEEKVSRLLPAPIAIRYRAVPFRANQNDVDMAMLEVDNLWLQDELSFIVGRRLNVYIANEARIVEALSRYYNAPCSERFIKLLTTLNRELREPSAEEPVHPQSRLVLPVTDFEPSQPDNLPTAEKPPAEEVSIPESGDGPILLRPAPEANRSIPLTDDELRSIGTRPAFGNTVQEPAEVLPSDYEREHAAERAPDLAAAEAAAIFATSLDPQEIGRALLSSLAPLFTRICLLKVTPARIRGWLGHGPGLDVQRLASFSITSNQPSVFLNLREGGSFFLGTLPEMAAHTDLVACWDKDLSDECVVFPVRVRDKLVVLVYADRGPAGLADLELDRVRDLCSRAADALERCILERKRRDSSAQAGRSSTAPTPNPQRVDTPRKPLLHSDAAPRER